MILTLVEFKHPNEEDQGLVNDYTFCYLISFNLN